MTTTIHTMPDIQRGVLPGRDVELQLGGDRPIIRTGSGFRSRKEEDREIAKLIRAHMTRRVAVPFVIGLAGQRGWEHAKQHPTQTASVITVAAGVVAASAWALTGSTHPLPHPHTAMPPHSTPAPATPPPHPGTTPPHTPSPRPHPPTAPGVTPIAATGPARSPRPAPHPPSPPVHVPPLTQPLPQPRPTPPLPPPPPVAVEPACLLRANALGIRVRVCLPGDGAGQDSRRTLNAATSPLSTSPEAAWSTANAPSSRNVGTGGGSGGPAPTGS